MVVNVNETYRVDFKNPVELLRLLNYKYFSIGILKFKLEKEGASNFEENLFNFRREQQIWGQIFLQVKYMNNHDSIKNELLKPDEF